MVLMARKLADSPLCEEQICKSAERTRAEAWIFLELLLNKLSLTWGWAEVLFMVPFLKILEQVGLTWALLSAPVLYNSIAANEYGEVNKEVGTLDSRK
jgi:hypothetical protein